MRSPKRNGSTRHIVFEGDETKNYEPEEFLLPPTTVAMIDLYVEKYRPILVEGRSSALFPGAHGGAKHPNTLCRADQARGVDSYGISLEPSSIQTLLGDAHFRQSARAYQVARRMLGHRSSETTTSFYSGHETAAAARHYDAVILKLRQKQVES